VDETFITAVTQAITRPFGACAWPSTLYPVLFAYFATQVPTQQRDSCR